MCMRTPLKMVNTRKTLKKELQKQEHNIDQANEDVTNDEQLPEKPTCEEPPKRAKGFDKTFVANEAVAGTSKSVLAPAEKVPYNPPPAARDGNRSKSKKSTASRFLADERKRLEIKAAEEHARIQMALVEQRLAAELTALEEKYSHASSKSGSLKSSENGRSDGIKKWIDDSQQALQQVREAGEQPCHPPAPAAMNSEATMFMLAQALKDLTASAGQQNNTLISRLSTPRELPTFSGDAMEWLNFKQAFVESTELCNYNTKENQWRLRKCLVGAAREAVSALLTSGSSPDAIMETLELQFGNPDLIVNKIMSDIKKLPPLPQDYIGDLVKFSIKIKNFVAAVKTLNRDEYLKGVSICTVVLSKLPTALLTKWSDYYHKHKGVKSDNKLDLLSQFLSQEATKITDSGISLLNIKNNADRSGNKQHTLLVTNQSTEKCKFCKLSPHTLINCRLFKKSLRKERWNFVRNNGVCFKCLSADHDKEICLAPMCNKDGCGQPHHSLLHYPINKQAPRQVHTIDVIPDDKDLDQLDLEEESQPESEPTSDTGVIANVNLDKNKVLLKVVRVTIHGPKGAITTYALLDDGATVSLVSADLVNRLGLIGKSETLRLRGAWNSGEILCESELVDLKISNENNECFELRARKIAELNLPIQKISTINILTYEYLSVLKDFYPSADVKPELLIGQDNYHLIMPIKIISRKQNEPCATLCPLGWCVHGLIISPMNRASSPGRRAAKCPVRCDAPRCRAPGSPAPVPSPGGVAISLRHADNIVAGRPDPSNSSSSGARAATCITTRTPRAPLLPTSAHASPDLPAAEYICCFHGSPILRTDEPYEPASSDAQLHELVRQHFTLESIGITATKRENKEEQRAISILNDTAKLINGRWEVGLPWKNEEKMTDSYFTAEKRLKSVEKRLRSDEEYARRYRERIIHLFNNNYAREVELEEKASRIYFLPHFGVDNSRKRKLRLVFDAASTSHGKSLNDYMIQGPDLLKSLYGIMLRFREHRIGITSDIRDMYLRIKIRKEDQNALRFLWRDDETKPIKQYAMTSLIFGGNCSPFIAQFIRDKNAQLFSETRPNAVRAIMHSHYVDDFIDSLPTESEAIKLIDDVIAVHKFGGFEIRGWTSNNKRVLSHLPVDQLSSSGESLLIDGENKGQRTLGLLWNPASDSLAVDVSLSNIPSELMTFQRKPTKREILRISMSVYDIFGILAPITIQGKIILKSIWKTNLTWDEQVTEELFIMFKHWITDFTRVANLNIPRWYFSTPISVRTSVKEIATNELQLHIFCDASPCAYAAAAYWRLINENGDVCVAFIACKNKIASMKRLSVPRLELQSGLCAARLAKTIKDEHRIKCDRTFYWTDSTTVLHWIRDHNRNYKEYVANRLGEIDELTSCLDWHYVPSHMNIADKATKNTQYRLHSECEWLKGPKFLYQGEEQWPKDILAPRVNKEDLELALLVQEEPENLNIPEPERFSSWIRLVRATAAVLKFINIVKRSMHENEADIIARAERLILKYAQLQSFSAEIIMLKNRKSLDKNSLPVLLTLTPYLDEHGIMRVGGRIDAVANVTPEMKRPIILHGKNYVTRLIVKYYHENAAHGYQEMVVNQLKQKYWIIRIRPTVKHVSAMCMACKIQRARPEIPRMGDLPEARMAHHQRPFTNCGADLFGPMEITTGRRREKRYAVLFTCLTVRAVHIELVHSLSTDSLILALRRMAARRGWPKQVFSDNGTNMRGAAVELKLAMEELNKTLLTTYAANRGVTWNFVPPASPHMAGAWERLIRAIKTTLKVTLKERAPREEVLNTLLAEAENMANSRPLTHVSVEPSCPEGLTPNHFLLGSSSTSTGTDSNLPLMGSFDDSEFCLKRQWRISQRLADIYWSRWVKEVLPTLLPRQKWHEDCRTLQVGDLVLVADPSAPRNYWARGVIQEVCPGKDGRVRAVHVKTKSNVLVRPAARIVRLPV